MLYRICRSVGLLVALTFVGLGTQLSAAVITTGCTNANGPGTCTFFELTQAGSSIQAGDLIFSGFTSFAINGTNTQSVNPALIVVTGLDDGGFDPGPGLRFDLNGEFDVVFPFAIDLMTTFTVGPVDPLTSHLIKDSTLTLLIGEATGSGSLAGVEQVLTETFGCPPDPMAECTHSLDYTSGTMSMTLSSNYTFDPVSSIFNQLTVRVWPGSTTGNTATMDQFEIRFSQQEFPPVPEPGSLSLMAAGLLAAAALMRKRKTA